MRSAADIRREFIDFFRRRGHTFVPSSPVVPHDDPSLLFTNAGMNQFKPLFLGQEATGSALAGLKRAANSQKCIRAGGKHNDLDDVGHDTYHHTFFEMLGNWSFGDYFKREAIEWAWELLTRVWGIDPDRLHATYFGGKRESGIEASREPGTANAERRAWELEPDCEARDFWLTILPPERVHPGNMKDNFWEMGDTGPCGPCSEIHIDLTPDKSGGRLVNAGDARVIEIWNLVFIQFNRGPDGRLTPLPDRHVDTGMGFERVCAVIRGVETGRLGQVSNYDTDVFAPIFDAICEVTGAHRYSGLLEGGGHDGPPSAAVMRDVAYRVIGDHIRTLTFAISDGAAPDKEGRGYVLRRILRRAVRYGWQHLDVHEPFLHRLVPAVVASMGEAFPELRENPRHVVDVLRDEEESFGRTLERGLALFDEAAVAARQQHSGEIRGEDAFKLHDTFGFPIDLTQIMAAERGLRVDIGEYERLMEAARERSRGAGKAGAAAGQITADMLAAFGATDDGAKYRCATLDARVAGLLRFDPNHPPQPVPPGAALLTGESGAIAFDRTCFYAEQGGQVGDTGGVSSPNVRFDVEQTLRIGDVVLHLGTLVHGTIRAGDALTLTVDAHREQIKQNHTATHVMNWALRAALGDHVQQRGSLVDSEKTRFDFSHPKGMTADEIARVEALCNEQIARALPVYAAETAQADALRINGLRAVFGEKYPERVRVVSIGAPVEALLANPGDVAWRQFSIEFCGGTHVANTSQIQRFVVANEEAVAKGVRRIVAVTGLAAQLADEVGAGLVKRLESLRSAAPAELAEQLPEFANMASTANISLRARLRLRELIGELQQLARQHERARAGESLDAVRTRVDELVSAATHVGETAIVVGQLPDAGMEQLKQGADIARQACRSAAVLFGVRSGEKATLIAAMSDDLIRRGLKAGDLVKAVAPIVEGGGGGPPTLAQAGGRNPARLGEALEAGAAWIRQRLG